jgi:hypothetical protein
MAGHWLGEADFRHRPFKPLVERSSRSKLIPIFSNEICLFFVFVSPPSDRAASSSSFFMLVQLGATPVDSMEIIDSVEL